MKKWNLIKAGVLFSTSFLALGSLVVLQSNNGLSGLDAADNAGSYSITLDKDNGQLVFDNTYPTSVSTDSSATTTDGNHIEMASYYGAVFNNNTGIYVQLKSGKGYIYNTDKTDGANSVYPLSGITSLTASFTGTAPILYYGSSANPSTNSTTLTSGTEVTAISGNSYFKIAAGDGVCYLTSLVINYSCGSAADPTVATSIDLSPASLTLAVGETSSLTSTLTPSTATNTVSYTSGDDSVATVSSAGLVTAIGAGSTTITATTDNGKTDSSSVTVSAAAVAATAIDLSPSSLSLDKDATSQLTATLSPSDATNTVSYESSDSTVASVSSTGLVTALKGGSATITATTSNGLTDTCAVTVAKSYSVNITKTTSTSLTTTATTAALNHSYDILDDSSVDSGDMSVTWGTGTLLSSSYDEITIPNDATLTPNDSTYVNTITIDYYRYENFTVTSNGTTVTGVAGTATSNSGSLVYIYTINSATWALTNSSSHNCNVFSIIMDVEAEVNYATSISLSSSSLALAVNETNTLSISYTPANTNQKNVTWSSSNASIASVSSSGLVTGVAAGGPVTITASVATAGDPVTATCSVTVSLIAVTGVSLTPTTAALNIGYTTTLVASVAPSNASDNSVTWSTSNSAVATVSNGVVTGISAGEATITVTTSDGSKTATCLVTVSAVSVTGVTLSSSSATISIGSTKTLTATIAPSNASNQNVTWSTSDSAVATVSGGVVTGVSAGGATITVTTADGSKTATCLVTVSAVAQDAWTIMIYMCGADLESGYTSSDTEVGCATGDLIEIQNEASSLPDNVNVIVEAGGAKSWESNYSSVISTSYLNRFHLTTSGYVKDAQITKASMGKQATFESFLEWGLNNYAAERTMVVFWNHGGAMKGCCYDENYSNDSLLVDEVQGALSSAFTATGRTEKLEVVGYDACLMGVQDIAEKNSTYFNYQISSEESEAGEGWDYDAGWLGDIFANPTSVSTTAVLQSCCDSFVQSYTTAYPDYDNDQTLSYIDLSKMAAYKTAWEAMASYMLSNSVITSSNKSSFTTLVKGCKYFAGSSYYTYYCIFDAMDFLNKLEASSTFNTGSMQTKIDTAQSALTAAIGYSAKGSAAGNSNGLAMFYSISSNSEQSTYYTTDMTNFTNWQSISSTYGS